MRKFACLLIFLCSTGVILSQSTGLKGFLEKRKKIKAERLAAGKPVFSPVVGPGYSPDAGLALALGGLLSFKTNPKDSLIQRSSLPATFLVSTLGKYQLRRAV